jgi:hypothetical protein
MTQNKLKISSFEGHPHFKKYKKEPVCFFHGTTYDDKFILLSKDAIAEEMIYMLERHRWFRNFFICNKIWLNTV